MSQTSQLQERIKQGRSLRKRAGRGSHKAIGNTKRDPVTLLEASSKGRVEQLIPLRYGRMLASPFAFYRGSVNIQAHDLAGTPHTGISHQICGDCHLMNFGGFATPERNLVFDLNDFDETHPGPWEWDLKRLVASLTICARHLGFKSGTADDIVAAAVNNYRDFMAKYAEMGALELWYDKITLAGIFEKSQYAATRKVLARSMAKAQQRTHDNLLPKMGQKVDGRWMMSDAPPVLFHIHGGNTLFAADEDWAQLENWESLANKLFNEYRTTLSPSHRQLLSYFKMQDLAFKVVGVGSVGTRCLVLLMTDDQDQPLFLQIKQAVKSVLAPYVPVGKSTFKHEGQRVVAGQRMMQATSDLFLGASTGPSGRYFYLRQLRDMKISAEVEMFDEFMLGRYALLCGRTLARAHARAGGYAPEISGYIGKGAQFAEALVKYANGYADQVQKDFEAFRAACRTGRLMARSEEDFVADFSV